RRLKGCSSGSKNSNSSNNGRIRQQKRRKLSPTSGTMSQLTSILLAEENLGKLHPDDFIDWLSMVERVFDMRDIPDKLKVKLVVIKLRQHASLWWDHVNKKRRIEGKSKNRTAEEVINEFDKLRMRCDVVEEEEQVVARFLGVLKPEIADILIGERLARIASTQALIDAVTAALPSPPLPPLPPSSFRYEVGESSDARPIGGQRIDYGFVSTLDAEER
ncbi:hypothetical protein Tco_0683900, partial [Tanacetum coccineum]